MSARALVDRLNGSSDQSESQQEDDEEKIGQPQLYTREIQEQNYQSDDDPEDFLGTNEEREHEQVQDDFQIHETHLQKAKKQSLACREQTSTRGRALQLQQERITTKETSERENQHRGHRSQGGDISQGDTQKYGFRLKSEEVIFRQDAICRLPEILQPDGTEVSISSWGEREGEGSIEVENQPGLQVNESLKSILSINS